MDESQEVKGRTATRDQVLQAMRQFDLDEPDPVAWLAKKSHHWVVLSGERCPYPPKRVIQIATGVPLRSFNTSHALTVLRAFRFDVIPKSDYLGETSEGAQDAP